MKTREEKQREYSKRHYEKNKASGKAQEKWKAQAEKRKHNEEYKRKAAERSKKYYYEKKNDPNWVAKERARGRKKYAEMDTTSNFGWRYRELKSCSKEFGVNCYITLDQLKEILENESCYLTGIKLSEHLHQTKSAYYLDRIGKKEYGGDGKRGGDYILGNVRPCIFKLNELRDKLDLTDKQAQMLFFPAKIFIKAKKVIEKIKKWKLFSI